MRLTGPRSVLCMRVAYYLVFAVGIVAGQGVVLMRGERKEEKRIEVRMRRMGWDEHEHLSRLNSTWTNPDHIHTPYTIMTCGRASCSLVSRVSCRLKLPHKY